MPLDGEVEVGNTGHVNLTKKNKPLIWLRLFSFKCNFKEYVELLYMMYLTVFANKCNKLKAVCFSYFFEQNVIILPSKQNQYFLHVFQVRKNE